MLLAFSCSAVLSLCIALATAHRSATVRMASICGFVAAVLGCAWITTREGLRFNFMPSMPIGAYRVSAKAPRMLHAGEFVVACLPGRISKLGLRRGYLSRGSCPDGIEPLLKVVVATSGDDVVVTSRGIRVKGRMLPESAALIADRRGRVLVPWPAGVYRVPKGAVWLASDNPRGWDSRYWGPVPVQAVIATANPVLTVATP